MSKKRKREGTEVDSDLVKIYDQLSNEDIYERVSAARKLLTRVNQAGSASEEEVRTILTRLFRGLCSGRKAARHGFAMALTEILTGFSKPTSQSPGASMSPAHIIDTLESSTATGGNVSGQDERDHYFGRVFGAEAIIQSDILQSSSDRTQWQRLLDIVLSMSHKKPWLRQECGWILYVFANLATSPDKQPFVEDIIRAMKARGLIRTPEGVAIWLAARRNYPKADLSGQCWKHRHPLAQKEIKFLPQIMKDSRSGHVEDDHQSQGSGTWSPTLHFAWLVVLQNLWDSTHSDLMSFADFWKAVVDEGLFRNNSSTERKSWGMLVWKMVLDSAPPQFLESCFTKRALGCLITELHGEDRYLRKASQGVLDALKRRFKGPGRRFASDVLGNCITTLIKSTDFADFDKLTRTNTLADLVSNADVLEQHDTFSALTNLLTEDEREKSGTAYPQWRLLLDLQFKVVAACLKSENNTRSSKDITLTPSMLDTWLFFLSGSKAVPPDTRSFLTDRIAAAFEQSLKHGPRGQALLKDAISSIKRTTSHHTRFPEFDDEVSVMVEESLESLQKLRGREKQINEPKNASDQDAKTPSSLLEGTVLLHSVLLFEVFTGDAEAVEILQDFPGDEISLLARGELRQTETSQLCDALIEILLSLASRASKLLRTATCLIFESLASQLSEAGIRTLARVLLTKENAQGQQEMFEAANEEEGEVDGYAEDGSDDSDSDVEMVNGYESEADSTSSASDLDSASDNDKSSSEADQAASDELAAFDAALASALGTRKPTQDDLDASSSSSSDSDMSDSQMLALDAKLAEVFRARKATTSKKKELKNTKENMINFKNRVLDLVEIYLKQQNTNLLTLELVLPLLQAVRITQTKQLADRLTSILREFCQRCKGANVPIAPHESVSSVLSKLREVHNEASLLTSNAHSAVASQASILLVKVLVRADLSSIGEAVAIYADTRTRQLTKKESKVQPSFFTDWNNWCTSARNALAK